MSAMLGEGAVVVLDVIRSMEEDLLCLTVEGMVEGDGAWWWLSN